jgi:transposase
VPRQWSTGGKTTLLGIGKRGNPYLRKLFILGARSLLMHMGKSKNKSQRPYMQWLTQLAARTHHNVVAVALANKIARIAWAVLNKGEVYRAALPA